jgi:cytochrome o ubiquinol oxidase operon protein cyoD
MSQHPQSPVAKSQHEHKTLGSYIIGFVLSLVFTIIPYYMVVNHSVTGQSLLVTILAFAVLQMLVQIIFFLHLGRGPKPLYNVIFFVATVGIILVVVVGSVVILNNLHSNLSPSDQVKRLVNEEGIYQVGGAKTGACEGHHTNHIVTIKNGQVSPERTLAFKFDTMTITNEDRQSREISFGPHPGHQPYAGVTELTIRKGMNKTFTLSEVGTYQFHDHLREETKGSFTVVP